jgi:NAD(P)-dependent dehydrogenase (short-subunit alcohol dehydrogenase family)
MSVNSAYSAAWCEKNLPKLAGKTALVTGAASGLGYETAAGLALKGAQVILADINIEGGRAAADRLRQQQPGAQVTFRAIDLANLASVRGFANDLAGKGGAIDILVNNAGILPPLQRRQTVDGFELKLGINVLGHFALTGLLLPALSKSPSARVVWVSSLVHRHASINFDDLNAERDYAPQRAYNQAKLACLMLALELQARAQAKNLPLSSLAAHPGVAKTPLGESRKGQARTGVADYLTDAAFWIAMNLFSQPQDRGALPILQAAASTTARGGEFYGPDGIAEMRGLPTRVQPSAPALDASLRQRLWADCERLTGITY